MKWRAYNLAGGAGAHTVSFVRLIFPRICAGCGTDLYRGEEHICLECHQSMPFTDHLELPDNPVYGMLRPLLPLEYAASAYHYGNGLIIQRLMHEVKYNGNKDLAVYLGKCLGKFLVTGPGAWRGIDLLVPVPLHVRKRAKRGFNQSELICKGMSAEMSVPLDAGVLYRKHASSSQTRKNRTERWDNVDEAFGLKKPYRLEGRHVLLVDDVATTGATLQACALTLMRIPGIRLSVAAVACAGEL